MDYTHRDERAIYVMMGFMPNLCQVCFWLAKLNDYAAGILPR